MRQTSSYVNHFNPQNYGDTSSYKVRPPANQQFNYHHKSREHYSGQKSMKSIQDQRPQKCSISSFYEKQQSKNRPNVQIDYKCNNFEARSNVKDFGSKEKTYSYEINQKYRYLNKENSRSLSHNSKGSNSIKMSDYVALQAKNLINNKEKFNYQDRSVNHMRSSSLQCYPNSFKVTRTTNYENKPSHPSIYPTQPNQIPSFGIQCRTTMSSTKPEQKRHWVSKYPPTMNYRIEDPSKSRNIQSQLDQRIQRLRASSTSTRHRERINSIEVIDQNRLDNMDKINIKIKNILTTLEKEQNHYKEKFQDKKQIQNTFQDRSNLTSKDKYYNLYEQVSQPSQSRVQINHSQHYRGRIKTQNDFFQPSDHGQLYYHHRRREKTESDLSATQLKYQKSRQSQYYPHSKLTYNQEPVFNKPSHTDYNVSSFYYYEDEQAILKSSQSLMTTSPEKSFKRHSAEKYIPSPKRQDSYNSRIRHSNSINPATTHNHYQTQNEYQKTYADECKMTANLLKNIPECQTQLIESNAFEFASDYNTFKQQHNLERQFNNYKLSSHTFQKPFNPSQSRQHSPNKQLQDYRTPQLAQYSKNHQLQTFKITESHEFSNKVNHITFKNDTFLDNQFTESLNNQANFGGKAQCKKTNLIYFKPEDKEKYLKSTHRQNLLNQSPTMGDLYPSSLDPQIKHQFTLPKQTRSSYEHKITQPNQYPKHLPLPQNKYDNCYSDSIKQTPRVDDQAKSPKKQSRIKSPKNQSRIKQSQIQSDVLNDKLKEYQERILKHQQDMINSNLFESHRTMSPLPTSTQKSRLRSLSKSNQKEQIDLNHGLRRNTVSQFKPKNDEQKFLKLSPKNSRPAQDPQRPQLLSQQNLNSLLQNLKKQRKQQLQLVSREKNSKQSTNSFKNLHDANMNKNQNENPSNKSPRKDSNNKSNNAFSRIVQEQRQQVQHQGQMKLEIRKYSGSRVISTPPKYSPRDKNAKNDHSKFIQNLRKQRQQVSKLSNRKSRLQSSTSVEIYGQRNRSESQNSHISSTTIIKGKNIDEEINKIQRKMQQFQQMKKQLHLQSQQNTQRSIQKDNQTQRSVQKNNKADFQRSQQKDSEKQPKNDKPPTPTRNSSLKKSPKYSKNIQQYESTNCNNRPKTDSKSPRQTPKSSSLLKIVTEENSFCKVRKSIIKQQKTNELKQYLNEELSRQNSARSHQSGPKAQSVPKKKQDILSKSRTIKQTKQNLPPTTTTIDSPKYSNGQKKVVFGLAHNLVLNQCAIEPSNIEQPKKTDVKTPKLLRNFKNKPLTNEASLIKKKAQKRGFRSQFINDLHEDNEVLCSAKKIAQELTPEELQNQISSRLATSQNRETLSQILQLMEQQIQVDERFRNEKKMFNALTKKDKWAALMVEYTKKVPQKDTLLSDVVKIFTLNEEQNNPFYSTRGVSFTLQSLVERFIQSQQSWKSLTSYFSELTSNQLSASGFNSKALDVQRKNFISIDDLTRFINMELNKYYRNRDLWLIWQRLFESTSNAEIQPFQVANEKKLSFQQVLYGFGVFN